MTRSATALSLLLPVLAAASLADARPAQAQAYEGPWCAYMLAGRDVYTSRCDLPNYAACQQEIFATPGTWCTQNPRYRGPAETPARVKKKQKRNAG
jgi:hypothetical protein